MHGKKEVSQYINACFVVEKHKAKYLRITLIRFKFLHQFKSNSKLWQVYLDEAMPHIFNKLTISSHMMMLFVAKSPS